MNPVAIKPEDRKEVDCNCTHCKQMCVVSPCIPTPEEVDMIIAAGYADRFRLTIWRDVREGHDHLVVAPKYTESGCTFLTAEGLCELHDQGLKPLEGRLAIHNLADNGLRRWMCRKWVSFRGLTNLLRFNSEG